MSGVDPRRVLLVVAPYLSLKRPALGVALLKAGLLRQGIGCDIRYLCFDYADEVGIRFYELIAGHVPTHDLVGDWIFAEALHGPGTTDSSAYEETVLRDGPGFYSPSTIEKIALARDRSPDIVRCWANSIDLDRYDIVGFSSTFQQTVASLALAKELKARRPDVHILCGGSNFEGVMGAEFHRQFSFIDVACSGEADETFPELVRRLRSGQSLADLPGLTYRADGASVGSSGPPRIVNDLDALPYPDHTEYVEAFRRSSAASYMSPELTMETSRGCWWGQKHHCTFCGLNGLGMPYRGKSPDRAYDEMVTLTERYGMASVFNTDNILNFDYFKTLFPRLIERGIKLELHYETKANLKRAQLRVLRDLGTTWFQPGIESLNSHVLTLMNKGVTGIQNVQLLRWAQELGFRVTWNVLCGFPGETAEDYQALTRVIQSIPHLQPPASFSAFRLDRFSPMFDDPEAFGLRNAGPYAAYRLTYPALREEALGSIAYFYRYDATLAEDTARALHEAWLATERWRETHKDGTLMAMGGELFLLIEDSRAGRERRQHLLAGVDRAIYLAGAEITSVNAILAGWGDTVPRPTPDEVRAVLDRFVAADLMLAEGDRYLSLALFSEDVGLTDRANPRADVDRSLPLAPSPLAVVSA